MENELKTKMDEKLEYLKLFLADIRDKSKGIVCYTDKDIENIFLYGYNLCLSEIENNETTNELEAQIEKLKKENVSIQQSCENYYNEMRAYKTQVKELQQKIGSLQGYLDHDIEYDIEQRNKELEEEVNEWKDKFANLQKQITDTQQCQMNLFYDMCAYKDELIKAKTLLKRCYDNYIYLQPLKSEIMQFLKDR